MSIDNEVVDQVQETPEQIEQQETPVKIEPRLAPEPKTAKSIRNLIKTNIDKYNKDPIEEPLPLTAKEKREAAKKVPEVESEKTPKEEIVSPKQEETVEAKSEASETPKEATPVQPQATGIAAPAALTKDEKALWDTTPKEIQEAFLRREKDTQKGIDNLKAKYQPIEDVFTPVKGLLQQYGITEAHAVKQLFDWHNALAAPDKAQAASALRRLAQSHNIDLSLLFPQQSVQQQTIQQQAPQNQQQIDPLQQIESMLDQRLQPVNQQLSNYAAEIQRQKLDAANNELANFSKDKPHFEKVRIKMAEIITTAANFGRPITLQDAYDEAVWGMPEIRGEILHEQEAKREAEFRTAQEASLHKTQEAEAERVKKEAEAKKREIEAAERARRANVSPRGTAPVGMVSGKVNPKRQTVADTINAVVKDLRAQA